MLVAFVEQAKGQKLPENTTDQEMLEIVMARCVYKVLTSILFYWEFHTYTEIICSSVPFWLHLILICESFLSQMEQI